MCITNDTDQTAYSADIETLIGAIDVDPDREAVPVASLNATDVLKAQFMEDTGRHFLDSGGAYGRHFERNAEDPPWENPRNRVQSDYVAVSTYHALAELVDRDETAVVIEAALYAFGYAPKRWDDAWTVTAREFAESVLDVPISRGDLKEIGLPHGIADVGAEIFHGIRAENGDRAVFSENTYNAEFPALTQDYIVTMLGGPYAEYAIVQIHGGADVRGGYTAPRVYKTFDGLWLSEGEYHCPECDTYAYESCGRPEWAIHKPDENRIECAECGSEVSFY